jgi:polar amino acid transport system substrate-binding protein
MLAFFLTISASPPAKAADRLIIVADPFPPFNYIENGEPAGLNFEIMKAILKDMNRDFELQHLPWKRALLTVRKDRADAVLDVSKDSKRDKYLIYPDECLSESPVIVFYIRQRPFKYAGPESLDGKRIGVMEGYTYGEFFDKHPNLYVERVPSMEQNFMKLLRGRLDVVISYKEVGISTLKKMKISDRISYCKNPLLTIPLYIGFSKDRISKEFVADFNARLHKFKKTGRIKPLLKKYN